MQLTEAERHAIASQVTHSLEEDLSAADPTLDITAQLIPAHHVSEATIITREDMVVCGTAWVEEVFRQVDADVAIEWCVTDGDKVQANTTLCHLSGNSRSLLTGERCALNFLQTLSATASQTAFYVSKLAGFNTRLLDTRKTIPGLRMAQKYAVRCGGGTNHRIGLFDAYLIKENHIAACGGIVPAVKTARELNPGKPVEVEVESLAEFKHALDAGADIVMLDNFTISDIEAAVAQNKAAGSPLKLEVSGNITDEALQSLGATGVDFISSGALTKHVTAIDLSMRIGQPRTN